MKEISLFGPPYLQVGGSHKIVPPTSAPPPPPRYRRTQMDADCAMRVLRTVMRTPASYLKPQVMHCAIERDPQRRRLRLQLLTIENGARNTMTAT